MNLSQLHEFLARTLGRTERRAAALLGEAAVILDASVDRTRVAYDAFEMSLGSAAPGRIQLTHVHLYAPNIPRAADLALQRVKTDGALGALSLLAGRWPSRPLDRARALLDEFRELRITNRNTLFSCEYDSSTKKVEKATLYASLAQPSQLEAVMKTIGIRRALKPDDLTRRKFDCLGVDFFPEHAPRLKVYELSGRLDGIRDRRVRARCAAVSAEYDVRHIILQRRMTRGGFLDAPAKVALRLKNGIRGEALLHSPALGAHRAFLRRARPFLTGQSVYYVRFDRALRLDVDFRKTAAPWAA